MKLIFVAEIVEIVNNRVSKATRTIDHIVINVIYWEHSSLSF